MSMKKHELEQSFKFYLNVDDYLNNREDNDENIGDITIWRYMSLEKLISLLDSSELFFTRPDLFDDPYDGISESTAEFIAEMEEDTDFIQAFLDERKRFGVNCWYINEFESEAMWKLYANSSYGIAIKSNIKRIKKAIKDEVEIKPVIDADYELIPQSDDNYRVVNPLFIKRPSFSHEKELRVVIENRFYRKGIKIPVDLNILIDKIHISPAYPEWVENVIKSVVKKYTNDKFDFDVNNNIIKSKLHKLPFKIK